MRDAVELPYARCRELLGRGLVGRAAVCTPSGPQIAPVNYVVHDDAVVFRTTPYSVLGTYAQDSRLAFEVDEIDPVQRVGWSVVATGRASLVEDPDEIAVLRASRDPQPWVRGSRLLYVRMRWDVLTGRCVGAVFARM